VPFSIISGALGPSPSPSYSVLVARGSDFEIPLKGSAWNYLGTVGGRDGILYAKRRYEADTVVFTFRALLEGSYLLEFVRQDVLADEAERRWIAVTVAAAAASSSGLPSAQVLSQSPGSLSGTPAPSSPLSPFDGLGADAALAKIKAEIDAGKGDSARELLAAYILAFPETEASIFMYAQALEAPGTGRDLLKAKDAYKGYIRLYPEGKRRPEAEARIAYIDRKFLEIR
jgi:hypothetical protein